ncbi:Crp/Fnr family transcriptional regulator [Thioclava marina]|nr:Crp/Fnr family transcriptional regulator [Thioclava marina]
MTNQPERERPEMPCSCDQCPFAENTAFERHDANERDAVRVARSGEMQVRAGHPIVTEGSAPQRFYTLLEGQAIRYRILEDGRRQVLNFLFPGDLIGLQSALLDETTHTTEALSAVRLCVFERSQLWSLFAKVPRRAMMLTWQVAREEHFLGDALVTVGQRSAQEALAWAFVTLFDRGVQTGLVQNGKMPFPVRQQDLADALGLSLVHTNKTLAKLRAQGLVKWSRGTLALPDIEALAEIGLVEREQMRPRFFL